MKPRELPHQFVEKLLEPLRRFLALPQSKPEKYAVLDAILHQKKLDWGFGSQRTQQRVQPLQFVRSEYFYSPQGNRPGNKDGEKGNESYDQKIVKRDNFSDGQRINSRDQRQFQLSPAIENLFRKCFNTRLPAVQIYQSKWADEILSKHRADAMTIGQDIYFRSGQYQPYSAKGLGLLSHEFTHVLQNRAEGLPDKPMTQLPPSGEAMKFASQQSTFPEHQALAVERFVYHSAMSGEKKTRMPENYSVNLIAAPHHSEGAPIHFADSSRSISDASFPAVSSPPNPGLSESDLNQIKEEIYRDLMMRIKIDIERGA